MADADTGPKPVDEKALLADIDRTREELARTIDAISDRVSPAKNFQRAMEDFRQRADQRMEQARQRADQRMELARQRADRTTEQVGQRVAQLDPLVAGVIAATVAVAITATALLLRRRRTG